MSEITKKENIYQIYKGDGMSIITEKEFPITHTILSSLEDNFKTDRETDREIDSYYLIDDDYKKIVNELYDINYVYEAVCIYNESKIKVLDICKLF